MAEVGGRSAPGHTWTPDRPESAGGSAPQLVRSAETMVTESAGYGGLVYTTRLPRRPESAGAAREFVTSALSAWGLEDDEGQALLVVTELMSNAFRHADEATVRVSVTRVGPRLVRVSVTDGSARMPLWRDTDLRSVDGRGLTLVNALSEGRWGVDRLRMGKRVWAEVVVAEGAAE